MRRSDSGLRRWHCLPLVIAATACGSSGPVVLPAPPIGADELALVMWVNGSGQVPNGIAVWRPGTALRLSKPADPDSRLFAFAFTESALATNGANIESCVVIGGPGQRLPQARARYILRSDGNGFDDAIGERKIDLRFAPGCEVPDCPAVVVQTFSLGRLRVDGLAVHDASTVTLAVRKSLGRDDSSSIYRIEDAQLSDHGLVGDGSRLVKVQPLPDGGFVGLISTATVSGLAWFDVDRRLRKTFSTPSPLRLSVGRDGFGIVATQEGAFAFGPDDPYWLSEAGSDKVSNVAVHSRQRYFLRTNNSVFLSDATGKPVFDSFSEAFESLSAFGIGPDVMGWVGVFELVRVREAGVFRELERPRSSGSTLRLLEDLGGGDFVVAGEAGLVAWWRADHWCLVDVQMPATNFAFSGRDTDVVWIGASGSDDLDAVAIRLDFSAR